MPPVTDATNAPASALMAAFEKVAAFQQTVTDAGPLAESFHAFYAQATPEEKKAMVERVGGIIEKQIREMNAAFPLEDTSRLRTLIDAVTTETGSAAPPAETKFSLAQFEAQLLAKSVEMAVLSVEQPGAAHPYRKAAYAFDRLATDIHAKIPPVHRKPLIPPGPRMY